MDDSERSYGYSRDIYHGRRGAGGQYRGDYLGDEGGPWYPGSNHHERSYEYGPEQSLGEPRAEDWGPEEEAVHSRPNIRGRWERPQMRRGPLPSEAGSEPGTEPWTWRVEGPYRGHGPRGYRRSDDRIFEDVCDRLQHHGGIDARSMEVAVEEGEVTLSGTAPDRRTKRLAEAVAETVRGVVDVHNRLTLAGREQPSESGS